MLYPFEGPPKLMLSSSKRTIVKFTTIFLYASCVKFCWDLQPPIDHVWRIKVWKDKETLRERKEKKMVMEEREKKWWKEKKMVKGDGWWKEKKTIKKIYT